MPREKKGTQPRAGKKKGGKKLKPFSYHQKSNAGAANYLNFLQTQAHNHQVDSLLKDLNHAQQHARRAVADALDEVYGRSGPMQVDPPSRVRGAPPLPADTSMTRVNPFAASRTHSLRSAIAQGAEHFETLAKQRRQRETPQDMEGLLTTLHHTTEPAVAHAAFKFMSSGEAQLGEKARPKGFNTRMNDLRRNNPSTSVPSLAVVRETARQAEIAGTGYPRINMMDTGNQYRAAGRNIKAPRIVPGAEYGVAAPQGFNSYFEQRLPDRRIEAAA